jgi:hypothetical protein
VGGGMWDVRETGSDARVQQQLDKHWNVIAHQDLGCRKRELVRHHGNAVVRTPGTERPGRRISHILDEWHAGPLRESLAQGTAVGVIDTGQWGVERNDGPGLQLLNEREQGLRLGL